MPTNVLRPQQIISELVNAGAAPAPGALRLDTIRRNPDRRDYLTRATFRVHNDKDSYHLTVGPGLEDLWKRSQAFASACPDLASRPLFFHRAGNIDYMGVEFVEGPTLERRINQEKLSENETLRILERVIGSLERTLTPSTVEAATEELEAIFERICASPIFSGLDQRFLREFVFPFLRTQAGHAEPQKRWTNGDFIAKNIIIDAAGNPRLIDYEFARQTHFYGEDAWRWRKIADIPLTHRALPETPTSRQSDRWLDALFLLDQITLSHEINGAVAAVATSSEAIDELLRLVSEAHGHFRSSVFYRSLGNPVSGPPDLARSANCQLFWSRDGNYTEEASQRFAFPTDTDVTVHFRFPSANTPVHLRLDPVDASGLVRISGLRIRIPQSNEVILSLTPQTGWRPLELASGLHRLADTPELNLLSLTDDPVLFLPALTGNPTSQELLCDVDLRFTRDLGTLPTLLDLDSRVDSTHEVTPAKGTQEPRSEHAETTLQSSKQTQQQLVNDLAASRILLEFERKETASLRQAYSESIKRIEQQRTDYQNTVETRRRETEVLQTEANLRIGQLSSALEEAEKSRALSEDKCKRMSLSISWRSTAPLRFLRRCLIDPVTRRSG